MKLFVIHGHGSTLPSVFSLPRNVSLQMVTCMNESLIATNVSSEFYSRDAETVYQKYISKGVLPIKTTETISSSSYAFPQKMKSDAFAHDMSISLFPFFHDCREMKHRHAMKVGVYELPIFSSSFSKREKDVLRNSFFYDPISKDYEFEGSFIRDKPCQKMLEKAMELWNRTSVKTKTIGSLPKIQKAVAWAKKSSLPLPDSLFTPATYTLRGKVVKIHPSGTCDVLFEGEGEPLSGITINPAPRDVGQQISITYPNRTEVRLSSLLYWLASVYPTEPIYVVPLLCRSISSCARPYQVRWLTLTQSTTDEPPQIKPGSKRRRDPQTTPPARKRERKRSQGQSPLSSTTTVTTSPSPVLRNLLQQRRAVDDYYAVASMMEHDFSMILKSFWFKLGIEYEDVKKHHKSVKHVQDKLAKVVAQVYTTPTTTLPIVPLSMFETLCRHIRTLASYGKTSKEYTAFTKTYCRFQQRQGKKRRSPLSSTQVVL